MSEHYYPQIPSSALAENARRDLQQIATQEYFHLLNNGNSTSPLISALNDQIQVQANIRDTAWETESALITDPLTGLYNRVALPRKFTEIMSAAERNNSGRSVLFLSMDLDGFKNVNDKLGHPEGDKVLIRVAERLQSMTRATDAIFRPGGDELMILFASVEPTEINKLIERTRDAITFHVGDEQLSISASIGAYEIVSSQLAGYNRSSPGAQLAFLDKVILVADEALYDNKKLRKQSVELESQLEETE